MWSCLHSLLKRENLVNIIWQIIIYILDLWPASDHVVIYINQTLYNIFFVFFSGNEKEVIHGRFICQNNYLITYFEMKKVTAVYSSIHKSTRTGTTSSRIKSPTMELFELINPCFCLLDDSFNTMVICLHKLSRSIWFHILEDSSFGYWLTGMFAMPN